MKQGVDAARPQRTAARASVSFMVAVSAGSKKGRCPGTPCFRHQPGPCLQILQRAALEVWFCALLGGRLAGCAPDAGELLRTAGLLVARFPREPPSQPSPPAEAARGPAAPPADAVNGGRHPSRPPRRARVLHAEGVRPTCLDTCSQSTAPPVLPPIAIFRRASSSSDHFTVAPPPPGRAP